MADQSTSEIPLVDSEQESESESQPGDVNTKENEKEDNNMPEEKAEEAEGEERVYTEQDLMEEGTVD